MDDTSEKLDSMEDAVRADSAAEDSIYLSWKEKEIRAALEFARRNPDKMISQRDIWKKYGLEY